MATLGDAAEAGYRRLLELYRAANFDGNLWFAGNTLHTLLNHLVISGQTDDGGVLGYGVGIFDRLDGPDWWRDDFGWWGNAFVFAMGNRDALGYGGIAHDPLFRKIAGHAGECFDKLDENWRDFPYSGTKDHATSDAAITGGAANIWQDSQFMSGRNSVTNEGFLLLAQGLARTFPDQPRFAARRDDLAAWFGRWIEAGPRPGLRNDAGLVLERPTGNGVAPDWYWSGDQGLFAGGYAAAFPGSGVPTQVIDAVLGNMVDGDGVLHEYVAVFERGGPIAGFLSDYATGKGVFMRGLGPFIDGGRVDGLAGFVLTNADAVWRNRGPGDQFTFNWNPSAGGHEPRDGKKPGLDPLIFQTAGLDALDAALKVGPRTREMPAAP